MLSLIVLAGCSGFATSGASPTATQAAGEYPPGVTAEGVSGPFTLMKGHTDVLDASYTVTQQYEIREANGTAYTSQASTVAVASDESEYLWNRTVSGTAKGFFGAGNETLVHYSNGSTVARKIVYGEGHMYGGDTEYEVVYNPDGSRPSPSTVYHGTPRNDERIPVLVIALSNVSVTQQNETTFGIHATSLADDSVEVAGERVTNVSAVEFTATVTSDGLVREYHLELRGTLDGREVTATEHVQYSNVGETAVEEPAWYDETLANSTAPPG